MVSKYKKRAVTNVAAKSLKAIMTFNIISNYFFIMHGVAKILWKRPCTAVLYIKKSLTVWWGLCKSGNRGIYSISITDFVIHSPDNSSQIRSHSFLLGISR